MSVPEDPASLRWHRDDTPHLDGIYDRWASSYDTDLREQAGYRVPQVAVELLCTQTQPRDAILDAGAGTGLVGEQLHARGYRRLTGIDISAQMLEQAEAKGVYRALHRQVLGEPLQLATATFDATISVCVFGPTHAPAHALDELLRVTKPGGHIVLTLRTDEYGPGTDFGRRLADTIGWTCVAERGPFVGFPTGTRSDLRFMAWAYRTAS